MNSALLRALFFFFCACALVRTEHRQRTHIASISGDVLLLIFVFLRNNYDVDFFDRPETRQVGLRGVSGAAPRIDGIRLRIPLFLFNAYDAPHTLFLNDRKRNFDKLHQRWRRRRFN